MATDGKTRYVISVLVADRVGILRDITSAVTDLGANIDGISQTVVAGYFTVIITATFPDALEPRAIEQGILGNFRKGEASLVIRPFEPPRAAPTSGRERYIVTVTGADRPGILKTVTTFLAQKNINIEDWYVAFVGPRVTHIGEITVPRNLDVRQVQDELAHVTARIDMLSAMQHENIFRATNEVGPIQSLLTEKPDV